MFSYILAVLALAASPISELRIAIPVVITEFHFPWYQAFLITIIGNLLLVPFILPFLETFSRLLSEVGLFSRALNYLFEHTKRRGKGMNGLVWLYLLPFLSP